MKIVCDPGTSSYYEQFIHLRTLLFTSTRAERASLMNSPRASVVLQKIYPNLQEYTTFLEVQWSFRKRALKAVVKGCEELRDCIRIAAELRELPQKVENALKQKMEALQVNLVEAAQEVYEYPGSEGILINPTLMQWW